MRTPRRATPAPAPDERSTTATATPRSHPDADEQARCDRLLVERILSGDEIAFLSLVERYQKAMVWVARRYVGSEVAAQALACAAWREVLDALREWEGAEPLRSVIFTAVARLGRDAPERRGAGVPPASAVDELERGDGPPVPEPVHSPDRASRPGGVRAPMHEWGEEQLGSPAGMDLLGRAIEALPSLERAVLALRDVAECSAEEACSALRISETVQYLALHRARVRLRGALDAHFGAGIAA